MHVLGTAGHVDHGKSSLVRALTGIDPDRLKEEKAREMTIDLGFAWLPLGDNVVGIIDVPGHRDFIENMLAGVGGIDAVLFVVAADEGVMPQTREHLAIIDLLRIPTGITALTKIDLVPDREWIELVQLDLEDIFADTVLAGKPIIPVSSRSGEGLDALKAGITAMLTTLPPAPDVGQPRLWIDRVFSVSGFGTVVTGTLVGGALALGQEVMISPGERIGRVRGLQSHHQALELARPGSRVAVNLSGVEKSEVWRGCLLALPGAVRPTAVVDVRFRHLADSARPLRHNAEVKLFCGSAETVARARLLEGDALPPGEEGWLQLELRDRLPISKGERFILRYPSPGETIGGGEVIETAPGKRWRRNRPDVIARFAALAANDPAELLMHVLTAPRTVAEIASETGLSEERILAALAAAQGRIAQLGSASWIAAPALDTLVERLTKLLADFHRAEPIRPGLRPERLRSALSLDAAQLDALVGIAAARGLVKRSGSFIALSDHTVHWSRTQRAGIDRLKAAFAAAPFTPPSYKEAVAMAGENVVSALIELGELRQISAEVLFTPDAFAEIVAAARAALEREGWIDVKTLRDRFNTSRKYALAVLEYLDGLNITRREGDAHVLASGDWSHVQRE